MSDSSLPSVGGRGIGIGGDNVGAAVTGNRNKVKVTVELHQHYGSQTGAPVGPVFAVPPLDGSEIPRPDVMQPLRDRVLAAIASAEPTAPEREAESTVAITTALRGAGGFGKTTVARMLVHDPDVRAAFPDGIVWVTLGEDVTGSVLAARVNDVTAALTGTPPPLADPVLAGATLGEALADRRLLLVVDDVWYRHQLDPFLNGGRNTVRLVTTRQRDTLPPSCITVDVDAMADADARALLLAGVTPTTGQAASGAGTEDGGVAAGLVRALLDATGRWPVLLSLVNGAARADVDAGRSPADTLQEVLTALRVSGPAVLDVADPDRRHAAVSTTVAASLDRLTADQRDRYLELAIFGEDVQIPRPVLERYWAHTAGWPPFQTHRFCQQLANLSLVAGYRQDAPDGPRLLLHDVIRAHLRALLGPAELAALDAAVVAAHRPLVSHPATMQVIDPVAGEAGQDDDHHGVSSWGLLDRAERYCWQWIPAHLSGAGSTIELEALMQDPEWLIGVLETLGPAALEVQLALTASNPICARLRTVVQQNSHLLSRLDPPGSLAATLASRFPSSEELAPIRVGLEGLTGHFRLAPPVPLPDLAHPALIRTLIGHRGQVRTLAVAPDGQWLATAGDDGTVRIWDTTTGSERHSLSGHESWVSVIAIAPDGSWLATGGYDGTTRIWDPVSGTECRTLSGHTRAVASVAIAPDGTWLATASTDGSARIWDPLTGRELHLLSGHTGPVSAVTIARDGSWVATAGGDRTARIWDPVTGAERHTLTGHKRPLTVAAADVTWLATAGLDGTVRLWDVDTGAELHTLTGHTSWVSTIAIASNGTWIVSGSWDRSVRIWDSAMGTERHLLKGHTRPVSGIAVAPDGTWFATTSHDGTARIWDPSSGIEVQTLPGHVGHVLAVASVTDSTWLATTGEDGTARIWNAMTGGARAVRGGHTRPVTAVAAAECGNVAASSSEDGTARIWDSVTGQQRHTLTGHTTWVTNIALAPNGSWLATAGWDDNEVRIWDTVTGTERHTLTGHGPRGKVIAIAPNGTWIATGDDNGRVRIWDPVIGTELRSLAGHIGGISAITIAPDSDWLAVVGGDPILRIWDVATGTERQTLDTRTDRVVAAAIAPDGTWLATSGLDKVVRIWELATGTERHALTGHAERTTAVAIAPDGTWLATSGLDQTVRIWDPATGTERHTLTGHDRAVTDLAIAPDGTWLASTSHDATVRIWDPSGQQLAALRVDSSLNAIAVTAGSVVAAGDRGPYILHLLNTTSALQQRS